MRGASRLGTPNSTADVAQLQSEASHRVAAARREATGLRLCE